MTAPSFVHGTHNMFFRLDDAKWRQDLKKSAKAHLVGYQEAEGKPQRTTLKAWSKEAGRGLWAPKGCGNPIGWDKGEFPSVVEVDGKKFRGGATAHMGAEYMGAAARFNPARDFVWVGLEHKSGARVLSINVHPLAGGTKPEANPDNDDSAAVSRYKDWGVGQYWLDVVAFAATEMSRNEGPRVMAPFWDAILLQGDFNAAADNDDRWYYPGALLPALFGADERTKGLDHLMASHGSDVVAGRRWTENGNTDHQLHFRSWTIKPVTDFPRQ